jgi:hypothetical protein
MMDWLYRFTTKDAYPDPLEEIDALCELDGNDEPTFLLLAHRRSPPLSGALCGEVVGLCTSESDRLILHGTAVVAGGCVRGSTPLSVQPIYGDLTERVFCPLKDLERLPSQTLAETLLSYEQQKTFLRGQSFVKRTSRTRTARKPVTAKLPVAILAAVPLMFPKVVFTRKLPAFTVVGLDPTAGTWQSRMMEGPKKMPSFALRWKGRSFRTDAHPLVWHSTNDEFWNEVNQRQAKLVCIDGPCGTNGPRLLADLSGWDANGPQGIRGGELALSRQGVALFWTTMNTVHKFDGASRWIARSLVLFSERPAQKKIETHPHGAFTFLWRLLGGCGALPKKSNPSGRQARLALLQSFSPDLTEDMVPNHDTLDAACAALVGGLHCLGLTVSFGAPNDGGQIWMPDAEKLMALLRKEGDHQ